MSEDNPPVSTGRGDDGTTTLLGAGRLGKDAPQVRVLGDIDEATSFLGMARFEAAGDLEGNLGGDLASTLLDMQRLLYRVMGDVAMPKEANAVTESDAESVDDALEEWRGKITLPNEFIIPGESRPGALLDISRTVVRRAERSFVAAGYAESHPSGLKCVNRLSDLLYVLARAADGHNTLSRDA